ncbi:MAG: alkaline phosphatase family protein [Flavisolibacter sp.]
MKRLWISVVLITLSVSASNTQGAFHSFNKSNKIFIITLDGFRWQEVFQGADSLLINDPKSTGDTAFIKALYWSTDLVERRKKLLPFFWNVVDREGQLFGNRQYQNKVNVSNPYALSYPGYNEILTGSVDLSILNNARKKNTNTNILEWLNGSGAYAGKVAAFTSWDMFPFILGKGGFYLDTGREHNGQGASASEKFQGALTMPLTKETTETRYDELTFRACREYVEKQKPSVVFLSFSGTDNAGHAGQYGDYLQQAHAADRMISELWQLVQSLPEYAGKTTLLITTDHGRGSKARNWNTHGFFVGGSSQTWFSLLGNGVVPKGEMKGENQAYQKDFRQLITQYLCKN